MKLTRVSTEELVEELASRDGVMKITTGCGKEHRLETKYENNGTREIDSDTVLVLNPVYSDRA